MAAVARLLPRYWDGRRLLQFLAGMALIALAFAIPTLTAPETVPEPPAVVTVVDAPTATTDLSDRIVQPEPLADTLDEDVLEVSPIDAGTVIPGGLRPNAFAGRAPPLA
ncbi:hypothetical protein [Winogradskya humida]|uniref:Uncharacterized protein n=1 Tax=Winogradskya humida TaxID=113566 RepID=A0ABQ3ZPJ7_9ACTN|nr:hypothetical protein [Actinoplanes humidus]GIE20508.1 hypothetical protein Ahu01nite_036100 [Actinoplanes humidus]